VNEGNHLWELRNPIYHSAGLESLNLQIIHFRTYVDINYFYYLHMRDSFLKLCRVFLKHPVEYSVPTSQEAHDITATKINRLILCKETLAVRLFSARTIQTIQINSVDRMQCFSRLKLVQHVKLLSFKASLLSLHSFSGPILL
jgi:hypothetical protein